MDIKCEEFSLNAIKVDTCKEQQESYTKALAAYDNNVLLSRVEKLFMHVPVSSYSSPFFITLWLILGTLLWMMNMNWGKWKTSHRFNLNELWLVMQKHCLCYQLSCHKMFWMYSLLSTYVRPLKWVSEFLGCVFMRWTVTQVNTQTGVDKDFWAHQSRWTGYPSNSMSMIPFLWKPQYKTSINFPLDALN